MGVPPGAFAKAPYGGVGGCGDWSFDWFGVDGWRQNRSISVECNVTPFNDHSFRRKNHRLPGHDYRSDGHYYITIVTHDRACYFGTVQHDQMVPNELGKIVEHCWFDLAARHDYVLLDSWQLMPNHFHGVLVLGDLGEEDGHEPDLSARKTVGRLLGRMKSMSVNRIEALGYSLPRPFWQRNYYDEIVRTDERLQQIHEYLQNNPANWNP